jgi:hypothetical protein
MEVKVSDIFFNLLKYVVADESSFLTSESWRRSCMYLEDDTEGKLDARVVQASCAVEQKSTMPCTDSVEVDMMADKIAASCWCHAVKAGL